MSRQQREPLRSLQDTERVSLVRLSRSASAPAAQVARARALLAVAEGLSYTAAAQLVGRHTGDTVARWVAGFNHAGLAAVVPRQGGGQGFNPCGLARSGAAPGRGPAAPLRRGRAAPYPRRDCPAAGSGA